MIYKDYTPKNQTTTQPKQGRLLCLEELDQATPNFDSYPWRGICKTLYWCYRRDLDSLADIALQQFKTESMRGLP